MKHLSHSFLLLICLTVLFASFVLAQERQSDDLFIITVNGKQGFMNKDGKVIIEPIFESVGDFADGLAPAKIRDKYGFIDKSGQIVIKPNFDEVRWAFYEGLSSVRIGEKWGYVNKSGKFVIEPKFDYGHNFEDDRAIINVGKNSELGHKIIDKSGKSITAQKFKWSGWEYSEGLLNVQINDKWGFVDREGKIVIPVIFNETLTFSEGLAAVEFANGKNQWGFIDKSGKTVISPQYEEARYFKDGLALVKIDDKYGFIDKRGNMVIEPKYEWSYYFSEGLAAVRYKGKWGFIDKKGRYVVKPKYDEVWSFTNGLAGVSIGKWEGGLGYHRMPTYNGKWGYIDKTGKVIWKPTE